MICNCIHSDEHDGFFSENIPSVQILYVTTHWFEFSTAVHGTKREHKLNI